MKAIRSIFATTAILALVSATASVAHDNDGRENDDALRPITVAAFGDWPYSQYLLDNAHLLTDSVNADRNVDLVVHVGDIHSGSMPCTSAGILPPIATSNPGWNQSVFHVFQQFNAPLVYTPGDNEWTDCHKSKQLSSGAPLKELASVRNLFFAKAGHTLGRHEKRVFSQAEFFDDAFPADSQFVENLMWAQSGVVFVTLNIPGGSNDDTSPWTGVFADSEAQAREGSERRGANIRWLQTAFAQARKEHAKAVVVVSQADMWDPEALAAGGAGLDKYTPFVTVLADLAANFGRPVLMLNGDSHLFRVDHPLADPNSPQGVVHHTRAVPNLTRIVVQGSTNDPGEWLRITIDPRSRNVFSWSNVVYCGSPSGSACQ